MTSIRGIAATWVVAYHLINNLVYRGWLDRPNAIIANIIEGGSGFAVDIFFVLSGYILATTYGVKSDFPTFIVNRIARVFPLHVIVLTAMVAGIIVMRQFGFFPENEDFFSLRALPYHYPTNLEKNGHFNRPIFPIPEQFERCDPAPIFQNLVDLKTRTEKFAAERRPAYSYANDYFTSPDADVAYALVHRLRPKRLIEIGLGNGTRLFRDAISDADAIAGNDRFDVVENLVVLVVSRRTYESLHCQRVF